MLSSGMFGAVHFTEHPRPLSLQPPLLVDLLVFHVSIRSLTSHFQSGLTVHDSFPVNKGCCRYFLLFFFYQTAAILQKVRHLWLHQLRCR